MRLPEERRAACDLGLELERAQLDLCSFRPYLRTLLVLGSPLKQRLEALLILCMSRNVHTLSCDNPILQLGAEAEGWDSLSSSLSHVDYPLPCEHELVHLVDVLVRQSDLGAKDLFSELLVVRGGPVDREALRNDREVVRDGRLERVQGVGGYQAKR